jgi:hypothetical protein
MRSKTPSVHPYYIPSSAPTRPATHQNHSDEGDGSLLRNQTSNHIEWVSLHHQGHVFLLHLWPKSFQTRHSRCMKDWLIPCCGKQQLNPIWFLMIVTKQIAYDPTNRWWITTKLRVLVLCFPYFTDNSNVTDMGMQDMGM